MGGRKLPGQVDAQQRMDRVTDLASADTSGAAKAIYLGIAEEAARYGVQPQAVNVGAS